MRYFFWSSNYEGEFTQGGMWTESSVRSYLAFGVFFTSTGILGVLGGLWLFFKGIMAVVSDDKATLRKWLLIWAIIGFIPSPGIVFVGILLIFVYMMYKDDRYDFFGLLLEDMTRTRRRMPMGAEPAGAGATDSRDAYATGYTEGGLYSDDYAQAAYGGGEDAYDGGGGSLLGQYDSPPVESAVEPEPAPAPAPSTTEAPACPSCGKPTEWIEEYGRYYCYDDDTYV